MKRSEKRSKSPSLLTLIRYEKARMLPLNFTMSYIITPLYVLISIGLLVAFGTLMEKDDAGNFIPGLLCLGAMALLSVGLLCLVPYVRKRAIAEEIARYDFDVSDVGDQDEWDFSDGEHQTVFNRYGIVLDGQLHYYNHIRKVVTTDNQCQRVNISLLFVIDDDTYGSVPLTKSTLKVIRQFNIRLINQDKLDYIIGHKEQAFKEIYLKGAVTVADPS